MLGSAVKLSRLLKLLNRSSLVRHALSRMDSQNKVKRMKWILASVLIACGISSSVASSENKTKKPSVQPVCVMSVATAEKFAQLCSANATATLRELHPQPDPEFDGLQRDGLRGDYIGGIFGTALALVTILMLAATWRSSHKIDYKTKQYQVFAQMLATHEEIIGSLKSGDSVGRDTFGQILSEFSYAYRVTKTVGRKAGWNLEDRIEIAYMYMFFGPKNHTIQLLNMYDKASLLEVNNALADRARNKGGFKGNQNRLAHYFRNLYAAYKLIDTSRLTEDEKYSLARTIRAKLSNYEQAVLTLNITSSLGSAWASEGLVDKYMPIKNVPQHFFEFDNGFQLKERFPNIKFEWE